MERGGKVLLLMLWRAPPPAHGCEIAPVIRRDVKVGGRTARNAEPVDPAIGITHLCQCIIECGLLTGTRSAEGIMASGHVNRINRPNTWLHRPMLRPDVLTYQPGAVHTWHKADIVAEASRHL